MKNCMAGLKREGMSKRKYNKILTVKYYKWLMMKCLRPIQPISYWSLGTNKKRICRKICKQSFSGCKDGKQKDSKSSRLSNPTKWIDIIIVFTIICFVKATIYAVSTDCDPLSLELSKLIIPSIAGFFKGQLFPGPILLKPLIKLTWTHCKPMVFFYFITIQRLPALKISNSYTFKMTLFFSIHLLHKQYHSPIKECTLYKC